MSIADYSLQYNKIVGTEGLIIRIIELQLSIDGVSQFLILNEECPNLKIIFKMRAVFGLVILLVVQIIKIFHLIYSIDKKGVWKWNEIL